MSEQYVAEASQKLTVPEVTGAPPAVTVPVKVTALPETTLVTGVPPAVTESVMAVGTDCDQPRVVPLMAVIESVARISARKLFLTREVNLNIVNAIGTESRLVTSTMSVSAIWLTL